MNTAVLSGPPKTFSNDDLDSLPHPTYRYDDRMSRDEERRLLDRDYHRVSVQGKLIGRHSRSCFKRHRNATIILTKLLRMGYPVIGQIYYSHKDREAKSQIVVLGVGHRLKYMRTLEATITTMVKEDYAQHLEWLKSQGRY
jgi:hypothetical protein